MVKRLEQLTAARNARMRSPREMDEIDRNMDALFASVDPDRELEKLDADSNVMHLIDTFDPNRAVARGYSW